MRPVGRTIAAILLLSTTFLVTACGRAPVVGVLLPESGPAAEYGASMRKAIELAIEEAEADGTYPDGLVIAWADSGTDPEQAATEFRRLAEEKGAQIVIAGTTSGEAKALLPVIDSTNTVCVSPSATMPTLTKDSRLFYRVFSSDELEGRVAGSFLHEDEGTESVIIFTEDSEQARGIEPPFRHVFEQTLNGKVTGRVIITESDWEQQALDIMAAQNPQSAYVIGYSEGTLRVVEFLRERSFQGTICVTSAFYSGDVVARHSELLDGVFFPQPAFDTTDERELVKTFVTEFRQKYSVDPDIYAAHAYDATRVVFEVVRNTQILEPSELRKTLSFGIKEFPGVTGPIQFNDYGDVHHNPIMFIIKDGQVRNYEQYFKEEKARIRERIRELMKK